MIKVNGIKLTPRQMAAEMIRWALEYRESYGSTEGTEPYDILGQIIESGQMADVERYCRQFEQRIGRILGKNKLK